MDCLRRSRGIARRWQRVARYGAGLADDQDDDARGGADFRFNDDGLPVGSAFGGSFGATGSTDAANLRTLEGLEEGFQRLRHLMMRD